MPAGKAQIYGGKALVSGGKAATDSDCCCGYPNVDYGCCEGDPCYICDEGTGADIWRVDWTGGFWLYQGEHDLACISCGGSGNCRWTGGIYQYLLIDLWMTGLVYELRITDLGARNWHLVYRTSEWEEFDGNCMHWYDPVTGVMAVSLFASDEIYEEDWGAPPSTLDLWPV
jgi:hypothetical protein